MGTLVIASFYFLVAYLLIKKEVRIYQIASSLLYAVSLQMIQWNITAFIVYLTIPISIAFFSMIKKSNNQITYFSIFAGLLFYQ